MPLGSFKVYPSVGSLIIKPGRALETPCSRPFFLHFSCPNLLLLFFPIFFSGGLTFLKRFWLPWVQLLNQLPPVYFPPGAGKYKNILCNINKYNIICPPCGGTFVVWSDVRSRGFHHNNIY